MPSFAAMLKNYLPRRLLAQRPPLIRHGVNHMPLPVFRPLGLGDFLALDIPPREMLLGPILPERSLSMLYAPRGLGKSWLALSIGLAVASGGSVLKWSAPKPRRALVIDGEMLIADLQARLALLSAGLDHKIPPGGFEILAADSTEAGIDLSTVEGQRALDPHLRGIDLLILDNLSTLLSSGSEGASDAWLPIQNWLLRLRRQGIAVLIVHHAGVNGKQRGTSRREDALDLVIGLRRPADYLPAQGARFEVHFEKMRHHAGEGATPFEAVVEPFVTASGEPGIRWLSRDLKAPPLQQAADLFRQGLTVRQVAAALGISRSEAGRLRQEAVARGLLAEAGENEPEDETAVAGDLLLN